MKTTIVILENSLDVEWDYTITSHGSPGTSPSLNYPGDPPEPPEFDLELIEVTMGTDKLGENPLEIPKWLESLILNDLYERDDVALAVYEAAADQYSDGDYED
jgi:hypothetical protein